MGRNTLSAVSAFAASLALIASVFAVRGASQGADSTCNLVYKAGVDPYNGTDGSLILLGGPWCSGVINPSSTAPQQLNDPTQPFKTIQRAIDAIHYSLIANYCASPNNYQGVVFALPGIYGEIPVGGQGEIFPIRMRDRVHLKGLNGRACVIRGSNEGSGTPTVSVPWPLENQPPAGCTASRGDRVVLVDFSASGQFKNNPGVAIQDLPWSAEGDSAELLDGFTLEGGDVQVLFGPLNPYRWPLSGRVTNCLFDMRHDPVTPAVPSTVRGPWIGILMAKEMESLNATCPNVNTGEAGYFDQKVLIANNTFLMAEYKSVAGWIHLSRREAVAVIDTTAQQGSLWFDTDISNRGVGNPIIANNLFRTAPDAGVLPRPFAMLGIDRTDTQTVRNSILGVLPTNVFASSRVGSTNGYFASRPVVTAARGAAVGGPWHQMWDCKQPACVHASPACTPVCTAAPLPIPAIELFDGVITGTVDPGFVGEWLTTQAPLSPPTPLYNDWRLMPGSPLEDFGLLPDGALNGTSIPEPACQEIQSFTFDHEGWGNPRIVGGRPDVGWDERHGLIVAGSWGNESISHNNPPQGIQPSAAQGRPRRLFILPPSFAGSVTLHGSVVGPAATGNPTAWSFPPPGALNPAVLDPTAPADYNIKWISFMNRCPAPTPWPATGPVVPPLIPWVSPVGPALASSSYRFINSIDNAGGLDNEGIAPIAPCQMLDAPRYFCLQAVQLGSPLWYGNLQFEYR